MNRLEVPLEFAGRGIERNDGIAEKVVPFAIEAVVVAGGAAVYGVKNAALRIDRHVKAPMIRARTIFPAIGRPRVVAGFTGLRHGTKFPKLRARARVVCASVARRAGRRLFSHVGADEQEILEN